MKVSSLVGLLVLSAALSQPTMAADEEADKGLKISGLIEVEAGFNDPDSAKSTSDITLATVELGMDYAANDKVEGHILFLFEEGENNDNIVVDEATITLHATDNVDVVAGRMYVPFGRFDSHMISDPLTLEIAETQEEAVQVGFSNGNLSGSVYIFKDDSDENDGEQKIDDFGMNIDYETDQFSAGISYISDVNDKSTPTNEAEGIGVHAKGTFGRTTLIAEHIEINMDSNTDSSASNFEIGFDLGGECILALAVQQTDDAAALDLPEDSVSLALSMPVYANTSFAVEIAKNDAYAGGTDENIVTLQLAYEF